MSRKSHKAAHPEPRTPIVLSAATERFRSLTDRLIPAAVALFSLLAFLPVLRNDFVNWDDFDNLILNSNYQGLGWAQLRWMFTTFHLGHYQPLSWLTFSFDYLLWGKEPFGYHLTNLLIHAANAALIYFLSRRLLELALPGSDEKKDLSISLAAAFAALLFAIHPLRVESVAWATERRDVLSSHFLFWTLWCYLRAATSQANGPVRQGWIAASVGFYLLSLLSKAMGMTLPVILLLLDIYPLKRLEGDPRKWFGRAARQVFIEKIPFTVLAIVMAAVALIAQEQSGALSRLEHYPLALRLAQASYGIVFYLWKTLWPSGLTPLYQLFSKPIFFDPRDWLFVASEVLVLAVTIGLLLCRRRWPAGLTAWACYIVFLSPILGLAQSGPQFVADRYSYLACLSWALLAGAALNYMLRLQGERPAALARRSIAAGCSGLIVFVLGLLTWNQTQVWRNSETLWRRALVVNPDSTRALLNLGDVLRLQNKPQEAIDRYQRALQIDPDYHDVYYRYAQALASLGQLDGAVEYLRRHVEKAPPAAAPHIDLGIFLSRQGKTDEGIREYRRALEIDPKSAEAYYGLGTSLAARGELEEAQRYLNRAIELNPEKSEFFFTLGNLLVKQNALEQAEESFRRAITIKPDFPMARNNLGRLLAARGDLPGAMEHFREALRADPMFAPAHESMAQALAQLGRREEAMEHYRKAVGLTQPGAPVGAQP